MFWFKKLCLIPHVVLRKTSRSRADIACVDVGDEAVALYERPAYFVIVGISSLNLSSCLIHHHPVLPELYGHHWKMFLYVGSVNKFINRACGISLILLPIEETSTAEEPSLELFLLFVVTTTPVANVSTLSLLSNQKTENLNLHQEESCLYALFVKFKNSTRKRIWSVSHVRRLGTT